MAFGIKPFFFLERKCSKLEASQAVKVQLVDSDPPVCAQVARDNQLEAMKGQLLRLDQVKDALGAQGSSCVSVCMAVHMVPSLEPASTSDRGALSGLR